MRAQCKDVLLEILPFFFVTIDSDTLSQIFLDSPLVCILFARALDDDGVVARNLMAGCH